MPTQLPGDDWPRSAPARVDLRPPLDHTAWCWGSNSLGALGDGTNADSSLPVAVAGGGTWMEISAGLHHVEAVRWPNSG